MGCIENVGWRRCLGLLLGVAAALGAEDASAQPRRDPAAAARMFDEGVDLLKKESWDDACAKFRASMELDPSAGTQINVALCHTHEGKPALAWRDYEEARK